MKKQTLLIIAILLFSISVFKAQTPDSPDIVRGGVLNGKAISLPAPKYPAAASMVGACGTVSVKVVVDEEGNIFSTETVSGHPLLRSAAENAARQAKFKPTLLSGQPVKISGILVYVFVCDDKKKSENSVKKDDGDAPEIEKKSDSEKGVVFLARRIGNNEPDNASGSATIVGNVSGQGIRPTTISGGVVNGKAVNLAAPTFPLAATRVRAGGLVEVQVLIDEEGNVIQAKAFSGHPMLRSGSENAAFKSKFKPTLLEGSPVKVSGRISYVYNVPMSFIEVGYELARVEKSAVGADNFPAFRIENYLPPDWIQEREDVKKIGAYFKEKELEKTAPPPEKPEESKSETQEKRISGADSLKTAPQVDTLARRVNTTALGVTRSASPPVIDVKTFDPGEFSRNLQPKIQSRLSGDDKNLWYFNLGQILGNISAELADAEKMQRNADQLKQLIEKAPSNIAPQVLKQVENVYEMLRQTISTEQKTQLTGRITAIKNLADLDL